MKRSSYVLLLLALLGAGVGAWFLFWPRLSLPADPLAVVPADALGVLRIRVGRVLASDAYKRLVLQRDQARGIERIKAQCGFNPLERVSQLVVFARPTPGGGLPRFAFAARGDLRRTELLDCVTKFTGGESAGLHIEEIGGITTLLSKKGTSRVAFIGRDAVLGGDADGVRAAIHALLGKSPSLAQDPLLSGLFRDIDQHSDLALVTRVPEETKGALRALSKLAGPDVQQLESVHALAANASESGGRLQGGARLVTQTPRQASELVALGKSSVTRLLAIPGIALTPMSGVLRGVQMEARGDHATFAGSVRVSTVEAMVELLPALEQLLAVPEAKPIPSATDGGDAGTPKPLELDAKPERRERRRAKQDETTVDGDKRPAASDDPEE